MYTRGGTCSVMVLLVREDRDRVRGQGHSGRGERVSFHDSRVRVAEPVGGQVGVREGVPLELGCGRGAQVDVRHVLVTAAQLGVELQEVAVTCLHRYEYRVRLS